MKCPNCEMEFESGYICPACKVDANLFLKTVNISDSLYNAGLARAKNADMTGAINCLNKSLLINKNNVAARNLIGLVYIEIGRIGDAIKEWLISTSLLAEQNPASEYIQQVEKSSRHLEKLNDAVQMYNIAFDYIRQKSDDMAIIQLKKAIDLNPKFIDALNLLTLCYLMQGENEKAVNTIEKTLAIDINNTIALHYYKQIFPGKTRPELHHPAKKTSAAPIVRRQAAAEPGFGRSFPIAGIISFILGALSAFAILYILIMPEMIAEKNWEIEALQNERVNEVQMYMNQLDDINAELTLMQDSDRQWQEKYDNLEALNKIMDKTNRILEAERRVDKEEYQEAVDAVGAINTDGLPSDLMERIQNIRASAYPMLTKKYHNDGVKLYNSGQYDESRIEFENAMRYMQAEDGLGDDILYYLGRIAIRENELDNARVYFQRILDEYPDGNQVANAKARLRSME